MHIPTLEMIEIIVSTFDFEEEEIRKFTARLMRVFISFPIIHNNGVPPKVLLEEEYGKRSVD